MLYFVFSPSCCCCLVFRPPEPVSLSTDGEGIGWRVIILGIGGLPWRQEASLGAGPTFNASSLGCRLVSLSVGVRGKQIIQDGFTLAGQYFKSWGKKQHISDKFTSFFPHNIVISVIQFTKVLLLKFITTICSQMVENMMNMSDFHPTHGYLLSFPAARLWSRCSAISEQILRK